MNYVQSCVLDLLQAWVSDNVTNDFQDGFIIDVEPNQKEGYVLISINVLICCVDDTFISWNVFLHSLRCRVTTFGWVMHTPSKMWRFEQLVAHYYKKYYSSIHGTSKNPLSVTRWENIVPERNGNQCCPVCVALEGIFSFLWTQLM